VLVLLLAVMSANLALGWWAGLLPFQSVDLERTRRATLDWHWFGLPLFGLVLVVIAFFVC
jgi:hypothetical protein